MNDHRLLSRFAAEHSEEAFGEIVRRHVGLVYSAALRQVRDPRWAEDITQEVFAHLARQARRLGPETVLVGWLHRDTRYTALDFLRAENRRRRREAIAAEMHDLERIPSPEWERLRPWLDEALDGLRPGDRDALLLRYLEQQDFEAVGRALGASGEAARKRVDRALERLRRVLEGRGIESSAAALGMALSAHGIEAVPAGLAAQAGLIAAAAGAGAGAGAASLLAGISSIPLALLNYAKVWIGVGVLTLGVGITWVLHERERSQARSDLASLRLRAGGPEVPPSGVPSRDPTLDPDPGIRDRADLDRLRREVPDLRARLREIRAAEGSPRVVVPDSTPQGTERETTLRLAEVHDVGQATPEDLLQSHLFALQRGDTERLTHLMAFDPSSDPEQVRDKLAMIRREREGGGGAGEPEQRLAAIRILGRQPAEQGDVWLVHEYVMKDGTAEQRSRLRMRPSEAGWRLVMGPSVQPVMEILGDASGSKE